MVDCGQIEVLGEKDMNAVLAESEESMLHEYLRILSRCFLTLSDEQMRTFMGQHPSGLDPATFSTAIARHMFRMGYRALYTLQQARVSGITSPSLEEAMRAALHEQHLGKAGWEEEFNNKECSAILAALAPFA